MEILGILVGIGLLILWLKHREVMGVVFTISAVLMFIAGVIKAIP
ncbi:hypothetical protein [Plastoroseomonas hellenica]|nr:hypothetical protein [Plastoroseomonas hellenica]